MCKRTFILGTKAFPLFLKVLCLQEITICQAIKFSLGCSRRNFSFIPLVCITFYQLFHYKGLPWYCPTCTSVGLSRCLCPLSEQVTTAACSPATQITSTSLLQIWLIFQTFLPMYLNTVGN